MQSDGRSFNSPCRLINVFVVIIAAKTRQTFSARKKSLIKKKKRFVFFNSTTAIDFNTLLCETQMFYFFFVFFVATLTRNCCRCVYCVVLGAHGASTTCEREKKNAVTSPSLSTFGQVCETHALKCSQHAWNAPTTPCALPACRYFYFEVPEVKAKASGSALVAARLPVDSGASVTWRVRVSVCSLAPSIPVTGVFMQGKLIQIESAKLLNYSVHTISS